MEWRENDRDIADEESKSRLFEMGCFLFPEDIVKRNGREAHSRHLTGPVREGEGPGPIKHSSRSSSSGLLTLGLRPSSREKAATFVFSAALLVFYLSKRSSLCLNKLRNLTGNHMSPVTVA